MKTIIHDGYDGKCSEDCYDICFFDNLSEPVIRDGGEPFKSCYDVEVAYHVHNLVDPSRSLAKGIFELLDREHNEKTLWPLCDGLSRLCWDLGVDPYQPKRNDQLVFWTMFPKGAAECFAESYMKWNGFLERHRNVVLVLNNPAFYADRNATERRLVEIAEDDGQRFALDRTKKLPTPETLAREIALLNHGFHHPERVAPLTARLATSIAETMSDWGLIP